MRLTLRTLLAHEHGLLNDTQAALISQKIEQSPFVTQLLRHLRDRMQRREILPFALETRGLAALENVARYLDHELPGDTVVAFENECFGSDRLLAEVAACHEILNRRLATPTPLEPALRRRLYDVVPSATGGQPERLEMPVPWTAIPSAVSARVPKAPIPDTRPMPSTASGKKTSRRRALAVGMSLAAAVAVMVTLGVQHRDQFQVLLEQHVRQEVAQQSERPEDRPLPRPDTFVVGTPAPEPLERPLPETQETFDPISAPPEVATTAFHLPVDAVATSLSAADETGGGQWKVEDAWATVCLPAGGVPELLLETSSLPVAPVVGTRLVVATQGSCTFVHEDGRLTALGPADLRWESEKTVALRYGQMNWAPGSRPKAVISAGGQSIGIEESSADARLRLTTAAVAMDGVNYARDTANQEVWIECVVGTVKLRLSSCEGTLSLEEGEILVAHPSAGVRSEHGPHAPVLAGAHQITTPTFWEGAGQDPKGAILSNLRKLAQAESVDRSLLAREVLAQMDYWEELVGGWNAEISAEPFSGQAMRIRHLLAQDQEMARRLEEKLSQADPVNGPLVFRLICGFSEDQRSEVTLDQLRSLTQHPESSVRQWASFQLGLGRPSRSPL